MFTYTKNGVWYVICNGSFSVWHTRSKAVAERVVFESNKVGALVLKSDY